MSRLRVVVLCVLTVLASIASCTPPAHAPTATLTLAAPTREADVYATAPTPAVNTGDPVVQIAENAILDAAKMRKLTLTADARLTELAAWVATQRLHNVTPNGEAYDFAASYLGLTGPTPQMVAVSFEGDDSLAAQLAARLARMPTNIELRRYGRAVLSYGQQNIAVLLITTADVNLSQPVPKKVHVGQTIHITGSVVAPLNSVHSSVTGPDGKVEDSAEMPQTFDIPFTPAVAGVHKVELLADGPNGPDVVANFPIYVDVDEPHAFTQVGNAGDSGSVAETAELMFKKLNESRAQAKLPPLQKFEPLVKIATANSEDMADNHFFAHVSPTTGDVGDRVKRAGLELGLVGENIALGGSANEMHTGLMGSPGHRGAILSKDYTHVGIGVAYEGDGTYVATEVFARIPPTLDLQAAADSALVVINQTRAKKGLAPLVLDKAMSELATAGAVAYFKADPPTKDGAAAAAKAVLTERSKTMHIEREWSWLSAAISGVDDLSHADFDDAASKTVGIGFAQGPRGGLPNALVVVIILQR